MKIGRINLAIPDKKQLRRLFKKANPGHLVVSDPDALKVMLIKQNKLTGVLSYSQYYYLLIAFIK